MYTMYATTVMIHYIPPKDGMGYGEKKTTHNKITWNDTVFQAEVARSRRKPTSSKKINSYKKIS